MQKKTLCKVCKKEFIKGTGWRKYCSLACGAKKYGVAFNNKPIISNEVKEISKPYLKPKVKTTPAPKKKIKLKKRFTEKEFYKTREWRDLRYRVLVQYGSACMCCRTTIRAVHVDHIKPRSKYPELELSFDNLQVLCEDCNLGKSNKDETDWRPKLEQSN